MATLNSQTILVVEDSPDLRDLLGRVFEMEAIKVQFVPDCESALGELRHSIELPALVLVDLVMPGMGGVELINQMKRDERLKSTPVAVMSGNITPEARKSGAAAFLSKPFDIGSIIELADRFIQKSS